MATTIAGLTPENYEKYRYSRLIAESGGNYSIVNQLGYAGGYQMGAQAAETVGLLKKGTSKLGNAAMNDPNNWVGANGAPKNLQEFLANPAAQDKAYQSYTIVGARTLETTRTPEGTYRLTADTPQEQRAGWLAAGSLKGPTEIANLGLNAPPDANGTTPQSVFVKTATAVGGPTVKISVPAGTSKSTVQGNETPGVVYRAGEIASSEMTTNYSNVAVSTTPTSRSDEKIKLPISNPLDQFVSSNYLFTLSSLSPEDVNFPDTSYLKGKLGKILISSAGRYPDQRTSTAYTPADNPSGQYDFFIENVEILSLIAPLNSTKGTNSVNIEFDVIEPYSMGQFLQTCQLAAYANKHQDYTAAPYLLTIEFVGHTEDNKTLNVGNTTRFLPIVMYSVTMSVSASGCKYQVKAHAWTELALTDTFNILKQDTVISGGTVSTMLQSGEHGLQHTINVRLKEIANATKDKKYLPDEVAIIFPKSMPTPSSDSSQDAGAATELKSGSGSGSGDPGSKLLLTRNPSNVFVQASGDISNLGNSTMGFDLTRGGWCPKPPDDPNIPTDTDTGITVKAFLNKKFPRNILKVSADSREFVFKKGTTIINAITEVMLMSEYCTGVITGRPDEKTGMFDWFRIESHTYLLTPNDNNKKVNIHPKLLVYRVVPYKIHSSKFMAGSATPKGYQYLVDQTVKQYNYIYTGKNVDVLDFKLTLNNNFATPLLADGLGAYSDSALLAQFGATNATPDTTASQAPSIDNSVNDKTKPLGDTSVGIARLGTSPTRWRNSDGVGRADNYETLVAKVFQNRILNSDSEKVAADLEILGDPYYIADSGVGNYTNTNSTSKTNITATGAMDYQSSEVDILFNFLTPVDLNSSGSFTFAKDIDSQLEVPFSGLYQVITVKSHFSKGKFTQTLQLMRRPNQNQAAQPEPSKTSTAYDVNNSAGSTVDPNSGPQSLRLALGEPSANPGISIDSDQTTGQNLYG